MRFIVIYPVDNSIQRLNNRGSGSQDIKLLFPQHFRNSGTRGTDVRFEYFFIFFFFNIRRESQPKGMKPNLLDYYLTIYLPEIRLVIDRLTWSNLITF